MSPQTISVILDQDKMSDSVSPSSVAIQSAEHLSIFSGARKLPYTAAVHCYAPIADQGIMVSKLSSQTKGSELKHKFWRLLDTRLTSVASELISLLQMWTNQ